MVTVKRRMMHGRRNLFCLLHKVYFIVSLKLDVTCLQILQNIDLRTGRSLTAINSFTAA